ncbi:MAG: hypothetical protein AB7L94_08220 [Kofleriaceae bacterium]
MLILLVPLISVAIPAIQPAETSSARGAQVRLAEVIGEADAVHSISVRRAKASAKKPTAIDISLDRDGVAYRVVASINARGEVTSLTIEERHAADGDLGSLSWLSPEIANATAITRVTVDEDDAVTLTTNAGDAFMIIPGRGSGGNAAVSARWAAAWDSPDA